MSEREMQLPSEENVYRAVSTAPVQFHHEWVIDWPYLRRLPDEVISQVSKVQLDHRAKMLEVEASMLREISNVVAPKR